MHNRSQLSLGPSFSAAPVPYSASLDEDFLSPNEGRLPQFLFEDNTVNHASRMSNSHPSMPAHSYGVNASFGAPEFDDSASFKSGHSENLGNNL